eukprot:Blabericola_migrator_1__3835@NODE_2155_length_3193_cov_20_869162_g1362_i0_p2_GENE_NODE_2155_length_3193_cov_20_869162_g1362_i0NODE_2155_length_3193_cov_20_869162_g1362_i0_p2_ORF_typecomplete_len302_score40_89Galactosyl_T/PF01762_21/2_2e36Fringe/PF02434_16/5_7e06Glyco_tranf_2_3/PF13641_6/0_034_NODE_2155_length_3193_cov_20_869162_g1362_i018052710
MLTHLSALLLLTSTTKGTPADILTDQEPIPSTLLAPKIQCTGKTTLVAAVLTKPSSVTRRQELRDLHTALGGTSVQIFFPVGRSEINMEEEASRTKDILIGDYEDTYKQLPYKVMSAIHWFNTKCRAPYFMKLDDDIMVNYKALLAWLRYIFHHGFQQFDKRKINPAIDPLWTGLVARRSRVYHDPTYKNFEVLDADLYPPYCLGPAYLMNRKMAQRIEQLRRALPRSFRNEDAMLGILLNSTSLEPTNNRKFITSERSDKVSYGCHKNVTRVSECACEDWFTSPSTTDAIEAARKCNEQE